MCVRDNSPQRRKLVALASLCLAIGLLLPMMFHPSGQTELNALHFLRGLLIGMSLSVNLGVLWKNRRQQRTGSL
jgi:hypothetical protein